MPAGGVTVVSVARFIGEPLFRRAGARSFQARTSRNLGIRVSRLPGGVLGNGYARSSVPLAMRLVLLILTLWLLLDVLIVASLAGARRAYGSWCRARAERLARLARTSL